MMLPAILVTVATFLLESTSSSPVYNMQPAFITTNIGTTGRNIRNLPCISRKNNKSGVCMFAIDCLKANGTHLGTCIDRFYFGSCCHVEPIHDVDNTIDIIDIPTRMPPPRISSTVTQLPASSSTPKFNSTTIGSVTVLNRIGNQTETTTRKTITTTSVVSNKTETASTTLKPVITISPKPIVLNLTTITTEVPKIQTFQTVGVTVETTSKLPTTTASKKPPKATTKPPINKVTSVTKPATKKPTQKPITKPTINKNPSVKPSAKPTKKPIKPPTVATTKKPTKKPTVSATTTTQKVQTLQTTSTLPQVSNEIPSQVVFNLTSPLESISSPTTNKVQTTAAMTSTTPRSTTKPSLVTWTVADNKTTTGVKNTTQLQSSTSTEATTTETWILITHRTPTPNASTPSTTPLPSSAPPSTTSKTTSTPPSTITTQKPSTTYIPLVSLSTETTTTTTTTKVNGSSTNTSTTVSSGESNGTTTSKPYVPPVGINMTDFTDVCGRRMFPEARIVGGEKSLFGKWPWQISLRQWRTSTYLHKCGAALLNENWAITAAHCVDNVPPSDLLLRLGEHDLSTESEPYLHQERRVQIVASHPQFDPRTFEYDLALLRFYEPVNFQPNILPVCVPKNDENFVGRTAHVTGWGRLYEDGPLPSVLQEVAVPVINNSVCESMYRSAGYIEHIPHIFICAGWRRGGFDSCEGDSGGPMVIQREDKRFLLAGVISWGIGCAEPNQPGVYTRISEFRDWINQILQF